MPDAYQIASPVFGKDVAHSHRSLAQFSITDFLVCLSPLKLLILSDLNSVEFAADDIASNVV